MPVSQFTTYAFTVPYLTVDEYKRAPTGVDITGLVPGVSAAARDAELANIIARASGVANNIAQQNLAATLDTDVGRITMNRQGELYVSTAQWPILEVTELLVGSTPSVMAAVSLTDCFIERHAFTVLQSSLALTSSQGPLQFAPIGVGGRAFAKWTYINGWPCTFLATAALIGATSIQVHDKTGIYAGTNLTIYDADKTETVTVTATPTTTTVAISACQFAHATAGVSVSALPPAIKQAAILLTSALIKTKGNEAVVMRSINTSEPEPENQSKSGTADANAAARMLQPFAAVR